MVRRASSKDKTIVYGAISDKGRSIMRQYQKFNSDTVIEFLKVVMRGRGKVAIIMDNAPQHKSAKVMKFFEENRDTIYPIFLPVATPRLSMIEYVWKILKQKILVSEHYPTLEELVQTVTIHIRAIPKDMDMYEHMYGST